MTHLRVEGGRTLSGAVDVNSSKNAGVALLCASLINRGTTTLRRLARIEEVNRIVEVLTSIGVECTWLNAQRPADPPPRRPGPRLHGRGGGPPDPQRHHAPGPAAGRGRRLPAALRRRLRPRHPHRAAAHAGAAPVRPQRGGEVRVLRGAGAAVGRHDRSFVLSERGDTVTENAIMAAAHRRGTTIIRNASPNYMVQDLCFYLQMLGVEIDGVGTTTLKITGRAVHRRRHRILPVRGPDRGDEPDHRRHRDELGSHHPPRPDRVHGNRTRHAGADGPAARGLRRVLGPQRPHPPGGRHHQAFGTAGPGGQDPPHAVPRAEHRQPALLRGDRRERPRARP